MNTRRWGTLLAAAALFVAIFVFRFATPVTRDGVLFLLIVPISLLAIEFGLPGGAAGAALAIVAMFSWVAFGDPELSTLGLMTRTVVFLLVGLGLGRLMTDHDRREARMRELERAAVRHQQALELNKEIVQGLAVAKMALEVGESQRALETMDKTLKSARGIVSEGLQEGTSLTRPDPAGLSE